MPYVSAREASTTRSAAAYALSRSGPVRVPSKVTRSPRSAARRRTPAVYAGARSRLPRQVSRHGRSVTRPSAVSRSSCPLTGVTAATQRRWLPSAVPGATAAASTPGSATWTRAGGSGYAASRSARVQALLVTTARAQPSATHSRARSATTCRAGRWSPGAAWPSGRCTSTTSRSRSVSGPSTSGTAEATSPSSRTTAPSGTWARTCARWRRAVRSGRGQVPGTCRSCTAQPAVASAEPSRRS